MLINLLGAEQVLLNLVGDHAITGLFDGEARERLGLSRSGFGHRVDNGIDLGLAEVGQCEPGFLRTSGESARFGYRGEVAVR